MLQFNCFREKNIKSIIKKIQPYQYVSFDIFDTLLKRDVLHPEDIFDIVGKIHHDKSFRKIRTEVERELRISSRKEEITLDEIYNKLGSQYTSYRDTELEVEKACLVPNPFMVPVYQYCVDNNKKIIITSDMYLPANFLKDILKNYHFFYDYCFISCEYGAQKVSGRLLQKVLKTVSIKPNEVIHIGDSIRGDFLGARKLGIKSILIPKKVNNSHWIDLHDPKQQNQFNVFINNHLDVSQSMYHQFGYAYFGPVLYGFVQWLHKQGGQKKIFFFARDGYLVKKIYDAMYSEAEDDYVYLSRRALSVPLLWKHHAWEEIKNYMTMTRFFSLSTFLDRLGLEPENYKEMALKYNLFMDQLFKEADFQNNADLKKFYKEIENDVVSNSLQEYNACIAYFKQKQFCGDIAAVDIGWNGSMQRYLYELLELAGIMTNMTGYYFGIRKELPYTEMYGYFYEPKNFELEPAISFMQGLFESFFLSHEGSTKTYSIKDDGSEEPVLYSPEYSQNDIELVSLEDVQNGAVDFCEEYSQSDTAHAYEYDVKDYSGNLIRFGNEPSLHDVKMFGDFKFFDTNIVFMAKPESMVNYLSKPRKFITDFSYSVWKAGFLKRLFKVPAPFDKVYTVLKKK